MDRPEAQEQANAATDALTHCGHPKYLENPVTDQEKAFLRDLFAAGIIVLRPLAQQSDELSGKYQAYRKLWISWRSNLPDMELRQAERWMLGIMERFLDEYRDGHLEASYDEIDHFFGLPKAPYDYPKTMESQPGQPIKMPNDADILRELALRIQAQLTHARLGEYINMPEASVALEYLRPYLITTKRESDCVDIEAGAIALCEQGGNSPFHDSWIEKSEKVKDGYRASARALAAAWGLA